MIEVWQADLARPSRSDADLRTLLADEEIVRADRFHFERDRSRFIRRRAFRRLWISRRLGLDPTRLQFTTGIHGKPALADGPEGFEFNCSASADRALLAISMVGSVGVDLEQHRSFESDLALVMDLFAPEERGILESLDPPAQAQRFFECWSRKEALVKAIGSGLYLPLDHFAVPLAPTVLIEPALWDPRAGPQKPYWISSLALGSGWSGAVATQSPVPPQLHTWNWKYAESQSQ